MRIGYIYTNNKSIAKEILIDTLVTLRMQYVEMEEEVLVECDYLIRFVEKEDAYNNLTLIDVVGIPHAFKDFIFDADIPSLGIVSNFPKLKKDDYKSESKRIKSKIKTKVDYRRKY